jgi:hypothetical protein
VLRNHHRPLHRKTQLARCFLLQLRSDKGRDGIAFALFGRDVIDDESLVLRFGDDFVSQSVRADQDFRLFQILIETTVLTV